MAELTQLEPVKLISCEGKLCFSPWHGRMNGGGLAGRLSKHNDPQCGISKTVCFDLRQGRSELEAAIAFETIPRVRPATLPRLAAAVQPIHPLTCQ